jgi:acetyl esterase/lipase
MSSPLLVPSAYLGLSVAGAAFALNAHRPLARDGRLSLPVFFAGWLTSELPIQHIVWQAAITAAFVWEGALVMWPGWIGLAVTLVSWTALVQTFARARRAGEIVERALCEALGVGYRSRIPPSLLARMPPEPTLGEMILPFVRRSRDVERIRGVAYGPYGRRNELDIHRPRGAPSGCPVVVQVHGGAWVIGDKGQQGLPLVHHLAAAGWVCVSINYRLSPRSTFPDHIVDVKRALAWVKENIARYGGDPGFVVITGGSAGGHLSSLAALTAGDRSLQPGFEDADTSVRACVPFYGVYDFTNRTGKGRKDLLPLLERLVFKRRFADDPAAFDRASSMSRVHADAPPFLVIHGTHDTLVPVAEARYFVELLRASSRAPVVYVELPQAQHAFEVFTSARTAHVVRGVARFLGVVYGDHLAAGRKAEAALEAAVATEPVEAAEPREVAAAVA